MKNLIAAVSCISLAGVCLGLSFGSAFIGLAVAAPLEGEQAVQTQAIPDVVSADASWQRVWASVQTADGIVGTAEGGLLFAQERTNTILQLDADGNPSVYTKETNGTGALSLDNEGRLFAVERTCTAPDRSDAAPCKELPKIGILAPTRQILADQFPDGTSLGRLNDIVADSKGGAYFTSRGVYFISPQGEVETVADTDIRPNGIMLSPDGNTLYATNRNEILAFDVGRHGATSNRRVFTRFEGDMSADGMAVDAAGRLYVSGAQGVHVIAPDGKPLGVIPVPRRPVSLAFSGPEKKTLYAATFGANDPEGKVITAPQGARNNAMTIYKIDMLTAGYKGRPK